MAWDQIFDEELADFDVISPAWDKEVDAVGDFNAEQDADNDLNDHADAAHDGAVGLEITFDDANEASGTINATAPNNTTGAISYWLNLNDLSQDAGVINILYCVDGVAGIRWSNRLTFVGGNYTLSFYSMDDGVGATQSAQSATLTAGWHHILFVFERSTGAGNDDGWAKMYIDGV
ncbi:unnamed protein product, partial [marine sediment metagenome]